MAPAVFSALYRTITMTAERYVPTRLMPLWQSERGPKTIFFWSPLCKWVLVVAGAGDITRPAEKLSLRQSGALGATGMIWARYTMVIIPKKQYALFAVNFFVGLVGIYQLSKIGMYRYEKEQKLKLAASAST